MKKGIKIALILIGIILVIFLPSIISAFRAGSTVWEILLGIGILTGSMLVRAFAWGIMLILLSIVCSFILGEKAENDQLLSKSVAEYCFLVGIFITVIPMFCQSWGIKYDFLEWLLKGGIL